jgi:hypothetical protein
MRTAVRRAWVALFLALGAGGCRGCDSSKVAKSLDTSALGDVGPLGNADFAPYLAAAHATIVHGAVPGPQPPQPPPVANRRAFVTWWSPGHPAARATALGPTLYDSVLAASSVLAKTASADGRVEIDVLTDATPAGLAPDMRDSVYAIGTRGYLVSDGPEHVGFVLPNEIVADKLADLGSEEDRTLKLRGVKLMGLAAERAAVDQTMLDRMRVARIGVEEHLEGAKAGEAPITLVRSMPPRPTSLTPEQLLAAVRAGADYLARVIDDRGQYTYLYDPVTDQRLRGYGSIRHAGATYALMEAYEELRVPEWATAGQRAADNMIARFKSTPDGMYMRDNDDEEQQKVGGGGLALVALVEYTRATNDPRYLDTMRALARFIVHQQYPDGHFRDNADVMREDPAMVSKKLKKEIYYFAGEAMLSLVRLYTIDPQPQWLEAARKAADWIIDVRDAKTDLKSQIHDHWMSYGLHDLTVLTHDERYANHAFKIARAILAGERTPQDLKGAEPYADYVGTFYDTAETTPTSTRLEALASDIQLARFLGQDEAWLRGPAMELACFMRGEQIDEESAYFAKNPARAMGGVREGLLSGDVRIDYPQHAMSAWLRLARELRDPAWGRARP